MVVQAYEYEKEHLLPRDKVAEADEEDAKPPVVESNDDENGTAGGKKRKLTDVRPDVRREPLRGFFVSTSSSLKSPLFRRLDGELRERRESMLKGKGWDVTDAEKQKHQRIS